jgi:hypothetical protein
MRRKCDRPQGDACRLPRTIRAMTEQRKKRAAERRLRS